MGERLSQCSPTEAIKAFEQLGFLVRRTTGGHVILRHPASKRVVSVPFHAGDVKRDFLFGLLKQAGVDAETFRSAL